MPALKHHLTPAFCILLLVCLQAALLKPYVVLVPDERTNLFTAALALVPALLLWRELLLPGAVRWLPWLALGAGMAWSASVSPTPGSSYARAFAFWVPAVAGIFCAKALLRTPERLRAFFHFLTFCFAAVTAMHLAFGRPPEFLGLHHHSLTGTLLLLSAGPIHMLLGSTGRSRWAAGLLLCLGYGLCLLAGSRFLALLPLVLIPALCAGRRIRLAAAAPLVLAALALACAFFLYYPQKTLRLTNYESSFYRLEGIPASWEIIKQRPLEGIGLHSSRAAFLKDFEPRFGIVDKGFYMAVLERNVTTDNQYLSLAVGIGVPLAALYFALLGWQVWRLVRRIARGDYDRPTEWALLFPVLATLTHLAIYDGLLYPQVCWFFHLLLGAGVWSAGNVSGASSASGAGRKAAETTPGTV